MYPLNILAENRTRMKEKAKILAIDDDSNNLLVISEILKSDFEIKTCTCGLDCIDILKQFKADVVLLDISMPEISGYDVCRKIRQHEDFSDINVMFLSGLSHVEDRLAGYEAGGDDFICKPFDYEELQAKINVFIKKKQRLQKLSRSLQEKEAKEQEATSSSFGSEEKTSPPDQETAFQEQLKKFFLYTNSVLYIQAEFPYCSVFCKKDEASPLMLRGTLKKVEENLKEKNLMRVHRSYLINPDKIQSVIKKAAQVMEIKLIDNNGQTVSVPVGRKYQKMIKNNFSNFFN